MTTKTTIKRVETIYYITIRREKRLSGGRVKILWERTSMARENVEDIDADGPLARVAMGAERTYNLGDYQSLRVSAYVSVPTTTGKIDKMVSKLTERMPGIIEDAYDAFKLDEEE
jgi:hypothetical protein